MARLNLAPRLLCRASLILFLIIFLSLLYGFFALSQPLIIPLAIVTIILILNCFVLYPYTIKERELAKPGKAMFKQNNSDALLIVSLESIEKSAAKNNFYDNDWSFSWLNTLEQELGSCSVCDVSDISKKTIDMRRLVIISRSASDLPEDKCEILENFVKAGGVLLLEQPSSNLLQISGIKYTGNKKNADSITMIEHSILKPPYDRYLRTMPLNTVITKAAVDGKTRVLMKIDNKPAICLRPLGKGHVISVLFDYGLQMVSLQQGIPSGDYSIGKRFSRKGNKTIDLVPDKRMLDNFIPFADLLEKTIFHIIEDASPLPRLWYFPYEYNGGMIMSHDEEYMGDASVFVTEHEKSMGKTSSFFLIPDSSISKESIEKIESSAHLGVHWNRNPKRCCILSKRQLSLESQIKLMKARGVKETDVCRIHTGHWGSDYTKTFRIMNASGITIDSSYLSSGGMGKGYMFGTGHPFYPIDKNGFPLPLHEAPVVIQDDYGRATIRDVSRLLSESDKSYHELLVFLYHPNRLALDKSLEKMWKDSLGLKHNHWITDFSELKKWLRMKEETNLSSSYKNNKLRISIDSLGNKFGIFMRKRTTKGAKAKNRLINQLGRDYILLSVPKGKNVINIPYK